MAENQHRLSGPCDLLRFRYEKGSDPCRSHKSRQIANRRKSHRKTDRRGEKLIGILMNEVEPHVRCSFSEMALFWYMDNKNIIFRIFLFVVTYDFWCDGSCHNLGALCGRRVQWRGHFVTVHRTRRWGNVFIEKKKKDVSIPLLIVPILQNCGLLLLHSYWCLQYTKLVNISPFIPLRKY